VRTDGLAQLDDAQGMGILAAPVADGLAGGVLDALGRVEVGLADLQVHDVPSLFLQRTGPLQYVHDLEGTQVLAAWVDAAFVHKFPPRDSCYGRLILLRGKAQILPSGPGRQSLGSGNDFFHFASKPATIISTYPVYPACKPQPGQPAPRNCPAISRLASWGRSYYGFATLRPGDGRGAIRTQTIPTIQTPAGIRVHCARATRLAPDGTSLATLLTGRE